MKARIQTYWDAEVKLNPAPEKNRADKRLERGEKVRICDISIPVDFDQRIILFKEELF